MPRAILTNEQARELTRKSMERSIVRRREEERKKRKELQNNTKEQPAQRTK